MKPVEFKGANIVFGANQPEYLPLPARISMEPHGEATSCWELSDEELAEVVRTRRIFVSQYTFHNPLQPVRLHTKLEP